MEVKGYQFILDENDSKELVNLSLTINKSRNVVYLQIIINGNYVSAAKYILNLKKSQRVIFLNKNTLDLRKENLTFQTPERKDKLKKSYYHKNYDRILDNVRNWQKNNPNKFQEFQRVYRKKTKYHCQKKYTKTLKGKFSQLSNVGIKRSKTRILSLTINIDQYKELIDQGCYYCNKNLYTESGSSLDRIDNSKGYDINNVIPCCGDCNKLRGDRLTVDETKYIMEKLIEYRKTGNNGS